MKKGWSMNKQIGLWIDHKRAVILTMSEQGENIQEIESGMGRRIRYRGATHPRTPYSAQYQKGDDQLDRQFAVHLNKFYGRVIAQIRTADSVLIFGPGEAKSELEKRLVHEKLKVRVVGIETADKMTERQFAAKVRRHFEESDTGI
jgi:N-methylhydantoinase A/oxoprolinase/acetone carboxylase beta subunit